MKRAVAGALLLLVAGSCGPPRDASRQAARAPTDPALRQADSLYSQGDFAEARALWEAALVDARARSDSASMARLLTSISLAAKNLGDYPAARQAGEEGLLVTQALRLDGELFRAFNALGLLAWLQGRLDEATILFDSASRAAVAVGDDLGAAKASNNAGLVHSERGEFSRAREGFVILRDASRAASDTVLLGRALINLAMADLRLGDPLGAVAAVEEARRLAALAGDAEAEENALAQMATAYLELGLPERAFASIDSALAVAEAYGLRRQVAEDTKLRGDFYSAAGDHRRALVEYARAQVLNAELELIEDQGSTLRNAARSYRALGHADSAQARARRALQLHGDAGYWGAVLDDQLLLADLALDRNDGPAAFAALAEARRVAEALDSPIAIAQVSLGVARANDRMRRSAATLAALDSGTAGLGLMGAMDQWEADALRARAHARLGNLDAAELAARRALNSIERVRAGFGSGVMRTSYLSQRAEVYADLVVVLLARGRLGEAFEVADAARGRALLEHLATARRDVEENGPASDLLRGELLLRRIDALVSQLRRIDSVPPRERSAEEEAQTRSLEDRLAEARSEYEALLSRLGTAGSAEAILLGAQGSSVADIATSLRGGELLVQYFVTGDRIHLFLMDQDGVRHTNYPLESRQLVSRVRLARDLSARGRSASAADAALRELYRILIAPIAEAGALDGVRRLILVPHEALTYLPFAALIDEGGQPLVSHFSLLVLPSASALPALRKRQAADGDARIRRATAFAPLPTELPASRVEIADVSRRTGAKAVLGGDATEAALRQALETSAVVHVATHGIMNVANPMFSRLEMAPGGRRSATDDGRLEVHEVLGVRIPAALVYLSGCETGRGGAWRNTFEQNEDYATLAQAFLFAGASNVVSTLWRIDDPAAATFAGLFYEALDAADPVDALAIAQRAMLQSPTFAAPFYWAAYQVSGSGELVRMRDRAGGDQ